MPGGTRAGIALHHNEIHGHLPSAASRERSMLSIEVGNDPRRPGSRHIRAQTTRVICQTRTPETLSTGQRVDKLAAKFSITQ